MPEQLRNAMVHLLDVVDRYHATLPQEVIAAAIDMGLAVNRHNVPVLDPLPVSGRHAATPGGKAGTPVAIPFPGAPRSVPSE